MSYTNQASRAAASTPTFARLERRPLNVTRFASILCCCLVATHAQAAWVNIDELHAADLLPGTSGVQFGQSVAADVRADGSIRALYVGAPNATVTNSIGTTFAGAGVVYVLVPHLGQWQLVGTLAAYESPQVNAHFGSAVAAHNGSLVVGEPDYDAPGHTNTGRLWSFQNFRWNSSQSPLHRSLGTRSITLNNARLGASVAVSGGGINTTLGSDPTSDGSYVVGGAPGAVNAGCVYVEHFGVNFNSDPGDLEDIGSVCSGNSGDAFGASVAVNFLGTGQIMLIAGAPGAMQNGNAAAGAAHAYVRVNGTLTLIDTLLPPNPALIDAFGTSVAIDSNRVYVGATGRDLAGVGRTGSVSLFEPAFLLGYDFERELFPAAPRQPGDLCGASIYPDRASGSGFAVGCPGADGTIANQGAVRVYRPLFFMGNTLWIGQLLSLTDEPHGADDLGRSVVIVDDRVYAGTPLADDAVGANNGAVFEFAEGLIIDAVFSNGFEN